MKHNNKVQGFETLDALAEEVGNLRYDALKDFLVHLRDKIQKDAIADAGRGRPLLSKKLLDVSNSLGKAAIKVYDVWEICECRMKPDED